jgi:hypothetical protein
MPSVAEDKTLVPGAEATNGQERTNGSLNGGDHDHEASGSNGTCSDSESDSAVHSTTNGKHNGTSDGGQRCHQCQREKDALNFVTAPPGGGSDEKLAFCSQSCLSAYVRVHVVIDDAPAATAAKTANGEGSAKINGGDDCDSTSEGTNGDAAATDTGQDDNNEATEEPPDSKTSASPSLSSGKEEEDDDDDEPVSDFSWAEYLKQTGGVAAPRYCFAQSHLPPANEFLVGMRLETKDPRAASSRCIAEVIRKKGSMIKLRLAEMDNQNDFWKVRWSNT